MICLTGGETTAAALARRLLDEVTPTLQEVRLDLLRADAPPIALLCRAQQAGKQLVLTCRGAAEGGGFSGGVKAQLDLLRRVLVEVAPAYLDLELSIPAARRQELFAARGETRVILSWHRFTPDGAEALPPALETDSADLIKIALQVDDAAELLGLRQAAADLAARRGGPVLALGMGPAGLLSRALYGRFGAPWTYAVADDALSTAPGQLSLARSRAWRVEQQQELTPLALIGGEQVLRSPGPRVYNRLFARRGLPYIYLPVVTARPVECLALLEQLGFGGCSVTMPAKRALAAIDPLELDEAATRLCTVNTIRLGPDGTRAGYNTDGPAVRQLLQDHGMAGGAALVLGAGGASAAAVAALQDLGCRVTLCGRDAERCFAAADALGCTTLGWEDRGDLSAFDAVVNATPCGADGASDPLPAELVGQAWQGKVVLDAVQLPGGAPTPLLRRARAGGARAVLDGRAWWEAQGPLQLEALGVCQLEAAALRIEAGDHGPLSLLAPGSKSMTQRALVLAALAVGRSRLVGPLECDDSLHMRRALEALGATVDDGDPACWGVTGAAQPGGGPDEAPLTLWCGEAGTVSRFLAPLSLLSARPLALDGAPRLRERPLGALIEALAALGVEGHRTGAGALPLTLSRVRPATGGARVAVEVSTSSQFASGLMMAAPALPGGLTVDLRGAQVSAPYLRMTLEAMAAFGVVVEHLPGDALAVPEAPYRASTYEVEGDWSSGAFLLAGGQIACREVEVSNLRACSMQGDRVFAEHLATLRAGGDSALAFDLANCSDLIAPLAAALAAGRSQGAPATIRGTAHARHKESDRVAALARGLAQAGVEVQELSDGLEITPCPRLRPATLDPLNDHRVAMAFGLLSLREPGIEVSDPGCVSKSYPGFWDDLERLRCR